MIRDPSDDSVKPRIDRMLRRFFLGFAFNARRAQRLFMQHAFECDYGAEEMRASRAALQAKER